MSRKQQKDRAVYLMGVGQLQIQDVDKPAPADDEVLVQMETVGICQSDVTYLKNGSFGEFVLECPMIMGHEGSGTVLEVGCNVCSLEEGDRVAIEPGYPCRFCQCCKDGRYNLCPEMTFCATPPVDGLMRGYFAHPADFCHKLPDCVDFEDAALLEPLSVAVHACERARVCVGSLLMIFGSGPIGLSCLQVARALGAKTIMISDIMPYRLEKAKCLGADMVLEVQPTTPVKCYSDQITKNLGNPCCCIDTTGTEICSQVALNVTTPGGAIVLLACKPCPSTLKMDNIVTHQLDVLGSFRYCNNYRTAMELVRSGMVTPKEIVTHRYELDQAEEAFCVAQNMEMEPIKVMVNINTASDACKCDEKNKKKKKC